MKSLDDRIKAATATNAPSMVPDTPAPPPLPDKLPDMTQLITDAKQRLTVARMIARHEELGAMMSAAKKERDKLTDAIKPLMGKLKLGRASWGEYRLCYFNTPRSTLDKDELLNHGVQPSVIAACTKVKDSYTLRITKGTEEGVED